MCRGSKGDERERKEEDGTRRCEVDGKKTLNYVHERGTERQTTSSNSNICTEVKITENEPPLLLCCTCGKYVAQATFNSLFLFLALPFLLSSLPALRSSDSSSNNATRRKAEKFERSNDRFTSFVRLD